MNHQSARKYSLRKKPNEQKAIGSLTDSRISQKIENAFNNDLMDAARKEIAKSVESLLPIVFDPFVGGGSSPLGK